MLETIIGEHPTLRHVKLQIPALAGSGETLVIVGEHGTGKSLLASHIHSQSPFASHKLITIDCSLLKDRDQRVVLFGTDLNEYSTTHRSPFETKTTVVIKNPHAATRETQRKLAAAVSAREIFRSSSRVATPTQCRIIFFLPASPTVLFKTGMLVSSLHDALSRLKKITLPPLRRRQRDIPLLARYFIRQLKEAGVAFSPAISEGKPTQPLLRKLREHPWSGNIAELKSLLQSFIIPSPEMVMKEKEILRLRHAIAMIHARRAFSLKEEINGIRVLLIDRALVETGGNRVQAARLLGFTEGTMRSRHARNE